MYDESFLLLVKLPIQRPCLYSLFSVFLKYQEADYERMDETRTLMQCKRP